MKYYIFKGKTAISIGYKTRAEAKLHGDKVGHKCRFCGEFAGGMSVCRPCLLACLSGPVAEKNIKINANAMYYI